MATTLQQVLDRLDTVIKAAVPTGTNVWRDRADAESRDEAPGINVRAREGEAESFSSEMDKHTVYVELRIYVRADDGAPPAEALHAAVHPAIVTDPVLAQLCESRRLADYSWDQTEADLTATHKVARYRFTYLIPQTTL